MATSRAALGMDPEAATAVEGDGAQVTVLEAIGLDQIERCLREFVLRVWNRQAVHLRRVEHAVEMRVEAEDGGAMHGVVAANPLEHTGAIVQAVRRHMCRGLLPGDDPTVLPDEFALREKGHFLLPLAKRPRG